MKNRQQQMADLENLIRWNVPVDRSAVRKLQEPNQAIKLWQTPNAAENAVQATAGGMIGVMISLWIENTSDRNVYLADATLEFPFHVSDFHWIQCEDRSFGYLLPELGTFPFDPSVVLNDRLASRLPILPDNWAEGFLLGEGYTMALHDEYLEHSSLPVKLSLFTTRGNSHSVWLKLALYRDERKPTSLTSRTKRRPLFELRDNLRSERRGRSGHSEHTGAKRTEVQDCTDSRRASRSSSSGGVSSLSGAKPGRREIFSVAFGRQRRVDSGKPVRARHVTGNFRPGTENWTGFGSRDEHQRTYDGRPADLAGHRRI